MIGDIDSWRAYATARGNNAPAEASDPDATAALNRASDYITYNYLINFASEADKTSPIVEEATYQAASVELKTPGFFTKSYTASDLKILTAVEGIKWTPISNTGSKASFVPRSSMIDAMLGQFLAPTIGAIWI